MSAAGPVSKLSDALALSEWNPDISWLTEHLAVGGCFQIERAPDLAGEHHIRAVVDVREEDCDDHRLLEAAGIRFLHLPTPDLLPVSTTMLDRGVAFAREHIDHGEAVLIHCQHGIGRSPLLALCIMVDQGLQPLTALRQAKDRRLQVSPSAAQYRGWAEWLDRHGHDVPDYHSFGCIAYRHLASR